LGGSLSYRRLRVFLDNSPADSAFAMSLGGESAVWSTTDYLLANVVDELRTANWQRSSNANEGNRPKPIPRPGEKAAGRTFGTALPISELKRRLAKPRKEAK
jgi:hypothetical protein